jgi:hypothetical protein
MTRLVRLIVTLILGLVIGLPLLGASAVSAAPGQLAISYGVDPETLVAGLPVTVTAQVSAVSGPLNVALVSAFPVSATADGTGQTITATFAVIPNGPPALYFGTLTFPASGTWHISSPNFQGAPGNDRTVAVSDDSLDGLPACHAADLAATVQWDAGAGNRFATISMTNQGGAPCVLPAGPDIQAEDAQGNIVIPRNQTARGTTIGLGLLVMAGQQTQFVARWVNLCPQAAQGASLNLRVFLSADESESFTVPASAPPCLGATQPSLISEQPVALQGDAVAVLRSYIGAINNREYDAAYALFGAAMRQQNPSPDAFAAGFNLTVSDDLQVIAASPNDSQTVVTIRLIAHQRDGALWYFHGTYTVGLEDGTLKILAANLY